MARSLISPYPQKYGRRYGLQQWGPDHVGLGDRGGVIDADYAINFDKVAAALDAYFRNHVVGFGYAVSRNGKVVRSDGGGSAYLSKTKKGFDINQPFTSGTQHGHRQQLEVDRRHGRDARTRQARDVGR